MASGSPKPDHTKPARRRAARTPRAKRRPAEAANIGPRTPGRSAAPAKGGRPRHTVNAVASAMKILSHLSTLTAPMGVTQLARELKLNTSTCFNILRTLAHGHLVDFDEPTKGYSIGIGVVDLAKHILSRDAEAALVRPAMERVARKHGITVTLLRRVGDDQMLISHVVVSDAPVRIYVSVGQRHPLLLGAAGMVMAAFAKLEIADLRQRFDLLRRERALSFESFMARVEETRKRGWAVDEGYYVRGTISVSVPVPVYDQAGAPRFTCSGTMFSGQYDVDGVAAVAADLAQIGEILAASLGP